VPRPKRPQAACFVAIAIAIVGEVAIAPPLTFCGRWASPRRPCVHSSFKKVDRVIGRVWVRVYHLAILEVAGRGCDAD